MVTKELYIAIRNICQFGICSREERKLTLQQVSSCFCDKDFGQIHEPILNHSQMLSPFFPLKNDISVVPEGFARIHVPPVLQTPHPWCLGRLYSLFPQNNFSHTLSVRICSFGHNQKMLACVQMYSYVLKWDT